MNQTECLPSGRPVQRAGQTSTEAGVITRARGEQGVRAQQDTGTGAG